jgi:hypothetical protein
MKHIPMWKSIVKNWRVILPRSLSELAVPLMAGVVTVAWAWWKKSSFAEALSAFGIGYLFMMSIQVVLFRAEKYARDETEAKEFRSSFASIQEALVEIRSQRISLESINRLDQLPRNIVPEYENMMRHADAEIKEGRFRDAVFSALMGFSELVYVWGDAIGLDSYNMSPERILREMSFRHPYPEAKDIFEMVNKMRNAILEEDAADGPLTEDQAMELIDAFRLGANYVKMTR